MHKGHGTLESIKQWKSREGKSWFSHGFLEENKLGNLKSLNVLRGTGSWLHMVQETNLRAEKKNRWKKHEKNKKTNHAKINSFQAKNWRKGTLLLPYWAEVNKPQSPLELEVVTHHDLDLGELPFLMARWCSAPGLRFPRPAWNPCDRHWNHAVPLLGIYLTYIHPVRLYLENTAHPTSCLHPAQPSFRNFLGANPSLQATVMIDLVAAIYCIKTWANKTTFTDKPVGYGKDSSKSLCHTLCSDPSHMSPGPLKEPLPALENHEPTLGRPSPLGKDDWLERLDKYGSCCWGLWICEVLSCSQRIPKSKICFTCVMCVYLVIYIYTLCIYIYIQYIIHYYLNISQLTLLVIWKRFHKLCLALEWCPCSLACGRGPRW